MVTSNHRVSKLQSQLLAVGLIVLPLVVFSRALSGDFLNWDDWKYVAGNVDLRPDHWRELLTYWYRPHIRLFIPLTFSMYAVLEWIGVFLNGNVQPWIFHAGNLLLHIASGMVLWKLLTRLLGDPESAAVAACMFVLHPAQTEAVCWIGNLNTLLSGFLAIVTLYFYVCSLGPLPQRSTRIYFAAACITTVLALLSKPSAAGLPIMAWVLHRSVHERDFKRAGVRLAILCAIEAPFIWIAHILQADLGTHDVVPWGHRFVVAFDAIGFYLMEVIAPFHLTFDYGRAPDKVSLGLMAMIGVSFLLFMLAAVAVKPFRRRPWIFAGAVIFLIALLPVLGFVPFDFQFYSTVADRYLYLAMVGPSLVVAVGFKMAVVRSPAVRVGCYLTAIAVLGLSAILSFIQAGVWESDLALFNHALSVNPTSVAAHQTLGFLVAQAADRRVDDPNGQLQLRSLALDYGQRALLQRPDNPRVQFNLANLLLKTGHPDQSLKSYALASGRVEDEASLQNNWGVACLQLQRSDEALKHFRLALDKNPGFADAFANAGIAYERTGQSDEARQEFKKALSLNPRQSQAISAMRRLSAGNR